MAYSDIYTAANDATFQGRCMAAAWQTAQHVIAGDEGYDASAPSKDFAYSLLRDQTRITAKQVAMQVLRNARLPVMLLPAPIPTLTGRPNKSGSTW